MPKKKKQKHSWQPLRDSLRPDKSMNEIDNFFRNKLNHFQYKGDPRAAWHNMRKLLVAHVIPSNYVSMRKYYISVSLSFLAVIASFYMGKWIQGKESLLAITPYSQGELDGKAREPMVLLQDAIGNVFAIDSKDWVQIQSKDSVSLDLYKKNLSDESNYSEDAIKLRLIEGKSWD